LLCPPTPAWVALLDDVLTASALPPAPLASMTVDPPHPSEANATHPAIAQLRADIASP
jgi:hypothetical protein